MKNYTYTPPKCLWFFNIVLLIVCVLAIVCYFFAPIWEFDAKYTLKAEQLEDMIGSDNQDGETDFDVKEIIGEEGVPLHISFSLTAMQVFDAIGSTEDAFADIVEENVNKIMDELTPTLNDLAKKTVKVVVRNKVKDEVHNQVADYIGNGKDSGEVAQELADIGIDDNYISEKTDKLVDDIFENGSDVDSVTESVMNTIDEVYADIKTNSAGKEGYEDYAELELSDEDRAQIEQSIREVAEDLADENGDIDPDELIAELLNSVLNGNDENNDEQSAASAAEESNVDEKDAPADLAATIRDKINDSIPEEMFSYFGYVFYAILALMVISMLPWAYVLLKLVVKFATRKGNTTVKVGLPIWFGWLFYLLTAGLPSLAITLLNMDAVSSKLASVLPEQIMSMLDSVDISVSSIAFISAICALVAFVISIFYMSVRRKMRKARRLR